MSFNRIFACLVLAFSSASGNDLPFSVGSEMLNEIDFDGDGVAEFVGPVSAGVDGLAFAITVDAVNEFTTFPGNVVLPSITFEHYSSYGDILLDDTFAGDVSAGPFTGRTYDNVSGIAGVFEENPIMTLWLHGTAGSENDDVSLIGVVVDARSVFNGNPSPKVEVYYHDFGRLAPNQVLKNVSLSMTGAPIPKGLIRLSKLGESIVIRFSGNLQESTDLIQWSDTEPQPPGHLSIALTDALGQFYRVVEDKNE